MGFANCPSFVSGDAAAKPAPKFYRTLRRPCPRCSERLGVAYDRNLVQLVERMGWGIKIGRGPDEADWGVDVRMTGREGGRCVVM